jgi:hypothetical protein
MRHETKGNSVVDFSRKNRLIHNIGSL